MAREQKMKCSECGVDMNRHGEKIDYAAGHSGRGAFDAEFGGALQEIHTCPGCGKAETRIES